MHVSSGNFSMTAGTSAPKNDIFRTNNDTTLIIPIYKSPGGFYVEFSVINPVSNIIYQNNVLVNTVINKDTIQGGPFTVDPSTFKPLH